MNNSRFCSTHARHTGRARAVEFTKAVAAIRAIKVDPTMKDPRDALLETVSICAQMRDGILELIKALEPEDYERIGELQSPGMASIFPDASRGARAEILLNMLAEWTMNTAKAAKLALDAGVEERLVKLAEQQNKIIVEAVIGGLIDASVPTELREPIRAAIANRLRLLAHNTPPQLIPAMQQRAGVAKNVTPRDSQ